jgi:isopentenyl-diphosphate delta-isomerase
VILPDFRYRAVDASGIVENEICPVYAAVATSEPNPADDEVAEWRWISPSALATAIANAPFMFSPWLVWQHEQLVEQKLS